MIKELNESCFVVEATSTEQMYLWSRHSPESDNVQYPVKSWEQARSGSGYIIGYLAEMPICVSLLNTTINGKTITFYHPTSQVVDYRMVEKWIDDNFKGKYDNGLRRAQCDAMNFAHCLNAIDEFNKVTNG